MDEEFKMNTNIVLGILSFFLISMMVVIYIRVQDIDSNKEQIIQQQQTIQQLRNDLVDTQYYYDEEIYRLKAQITAYDDVLQDILEEENVEYVYVDVTYDDLLYYTEELFEAMLQLQNGEYYIEVDFDTEQFIVYEIIDGEEYFSGIYTFEDTIYDYFDLD